MASRGPLIATPAQADVLLRPRQSVAIFGHGNTGSKQTGVFFVAAEIAAHGIATIAINAVGHGNGPLGTLTVNQTTGDAVTFPAGGRGVDLNGDGTIDLNEGVAAAPPIGLRDGVRQTVVDRPIFWVTIKKCGPFTLRLKS